MAAASPRGKARITDAVYLLTVLFGGVGESIHGRLVVPGDAAATATNLLAFFSLVGIAINTLSRLFYIAP